MLIPKIIVISVETQWLAFNQGGLEVGFQVFVGTTPALWLKASASFSAGMSTIFGISAQKILKKGFVHRFLNLFPP